MRIDLATMAAHSDHENEDFVGATVDTVALLDGAGAAGAESGCIHGVAWYARTLGTTLLQTTSTRPKYSLREVLRHSIAQVTQSHEKTCNIHHPGTPSATVVVARLLDGHLEHLVLSDSTLLIQTDNRLLHLTDNRESIVGKRYRTAMDATPNGTPGHARELRSYVETMRRHRNTTDGFWVASTDPRAADEATHGEIPLSTVKSFALLSDGATRMVDSFNMADWPTVLDILATKGSNALLQQTRDAELSDPDGRRWPRGKTTDDATAAYVIP